MQNHVFGADRYRSLHLGAQRAHRFLQHLGIGAGNVDQVIGVNDQRLQVVGGSQAGHRLVLFGRDVVRPPHAADWS